MPSPVRNVVCFGDSNTWGYSAEHDARLGWQQRWPGVLSRELGDEWQIIEEGLNGRTTMFEVPEQADRSGLRWLPIALETHMPIDVLVLAVGTNDLFASPTLSARDAVAGVAALVDCARAHEGSPREVVVQIPPPFGEELLPEWLADSPQGMAESRRFGEEFNRLATTHAVRLLDLAGCVTVSPRDGLHYEAADHEAIGRATATIIRSLPTN